MDARKSMWILAAPSAKAKAFVRALLVLSLLSQLALGTSACGDADLAIVGRAPTLPTLVPADPNDDDD